MRTAFAIATSVMVIAGVYLLAHGLSFVITGDHKLPPAVNAITAFISMIWAFTCMMNLMDNSQKEEDNEDTQGS